MFIVPPVADQVTAVFVVPVTVAVNSWVAPGWSEAVVGPTVIAIGTVTFTVADADFVASATLVAVTV